MELLAILSSQIITYVQSISSCRVYHWRQRFIFFGETTLHYVTVLFSITKHLKLFNILQLNPQQDVCKELQPITLHEDDVNNRIHFEEGQSA